VNEFARVLVTGSSGFISSNLVCELEIRGRKVLKKLASRLLDKKEAMRAGKVAPNGKKV
jgi:nucleoside-diphosphate-sugar epimerase